MADDDPLPELIEAVADGTLDRRRLPGTHQDPTISKLLAELQILAGVSEVHRSQVAGDEPTTATAGFDSVSTSRTQPTPVTGADDGSGPIDVSPARLTQWGNFELIRKVGEGTFGEVFQARDLWLGHDVALKLLKANVTDRARMLHEARMLVRVRHLNVVTVHGADVHSGRLGFWMDFVEGATLHEAIRREGPRSAGEAFAWGQDLCRALAAVHAAGIVHRDVKAQNVMRRTSDGRLVLMDFGAGEILGKPRAGAAAGTPLYLAPELLHGAVASRSSDIYALGVLLFFLVSRKFPVQATTWDELIAAHQRHERVRLEDVRPDMPAAFVDVVERALRTDPAHRFASAGEMLAAMRGLDSGPLSISSTPLPVVTPPPTSQMRQTAIRVGGVSLGSVQSDAGARVCGLLVVRSGVQDRPVLRQRLLELPHGRRRRRAANRAHLGRRIRRRRGVRGRPAPVRDLARGQRTAQEQSPGARRSRGPRHGDLRRRRIGLRGHDNVVLSGVRGARRNCGRGRPRLPTWRRSRRVEPTRTMECCRPFSVSRLVSPPGSGFRHSKGAAMFPRHFGPCDGRRSVSRC